MLKRHDLSGIYIFDKFPDEDSRHPTRIEDCQEEVRDAWLSKLEPEALLNTCKHLCDTLHMVAEQFDIYAGNPESD